MFPDKRGAKWELRVGDTASLVTQLAPEVYGVVALSKAALVTYPSKTQALKAADVLDDAAFKAGQIQERAPIGTERQVLQTPEVKAQLTAEANRKGATEAIEAEAKANEIVVTGKRRGKPDVAQKNVAAEGTQGSLKADKVAQTILTRPHITELRARHILYGDGTGGGHLFPGGPSKSSFPKSWSATRILNEVERVAADVNISSRTQANGRIVKDVTIDGINMRVVQESSANGNGVVTAFPTNVIRNP